MAIVVAIIGALTALNTIISFVAMAGILALVDWVNKR